MTYSTNKVFIKDFKGERVYKNFPDMDFLCVFAHINWCEKCCKSVCLVDTVMCGVIELSEEIPEACTVSLRATGTRCVNISFAIDKQSDYLKT